MIAERRRGFRELLDDRRGLLDADRYEAVVERIVRAMTEAFKGGRKVLWMGNGGSAADAQHLAALFSGRFLRERPALPSEALSVNSSAVTAIANDYGYDHVCSRARSKRSRNPETWWWASLRRAVPKISCWRAGSRQTPVEP